MAARQPAHPGWARGGRRLFCMAVPHGGHVGVHSVRRAGKPRRGERALPFRRGRMRGAFCHLGFFQRAFVLSPGALRAGRRVHVDGLRRSVDPARAGRVPVGACASFGMRLRVFVHAVRRIRVPVLLRVRQALHTRHLRLRHHRLRGASVRRQGDELLLCAAVPLGGARRVRPAAVLLPPAGPPARRSEGVRRAAPRGLALVSGHGHVGHGGGVRLGVSAVHADRAFVGVRGSGRRWWPPRACSCCSIP